MVRKYAEVQSYERPGRPEGPSCKRWNHARAVSNLMSCVVLLTFPAKHDDYWDYQRTLKFDIYTRKLLL